MSSTPQSIAEMTTEQRDACGQTLAQLVKPNVPRNSHFVLILFDGTTASDQNSELIYTGSIPPDSVPMVFQSIAQSFAKQFNPERN